MQYLQYGAKNCIRAGFSDCRTTLSKSYGFRSRTDDTAPFVCRWPFTRDLFWVRPFVKASVLCPFVVTLLGGGIERAGIGGNSVEGSFLAGSFDLSRVGGLSGIDGLMGGSTIAVLAIVGVDFVAFKGIRIFSFSFSCCVFFGGKGGRADGSYTGANILPLSIDGTLEDGLLVVPIEIVDMVDTTEEIDSIEPRRLNCSEGLRGGKAGD